MKTPLVIPPTVALLVVLSWNVAQRREVLAQQESSAELRKQIAAVKAQGAGNDSLARPTTGAALLPTAGSIDWAGLSERISELRNGTAASDVKAMEALQNQVAAMTREEIIAALDRIAAMGLDEEARRPLEELLIAPLIAVDPQLALERFSGHIREGSPGVVAALATALQTWASQDVKAASSWLDSQIQAGLFDSLTLDGRSNERIQFEASLLGELLATDPAAASARLAAFPENQRREVLEPISFAELDEAAQRAYVELVRNLVPGDENPGSLVHIIAELVPNGGYKSVDAFLDRIGASAAERAVSARQAANSQLSTLASERPLTRDDVEDMRTWLKNHAPDDVDAVTGRTLGEVTQDGGKLSFKEASDLVFHYQKSTGNDDVLVAFLRSFAARSNLERATTLAGMIQDPALRQKILDEIQ